MKADAILEQLPEVYICWKNMNSVFQGCNQNFSNLVGKPKSQIIGRRDAFSEKHVKDDEEVRRTGIPKLHMKETIPGADGKDIDILTNKGPWRNENGQIIGTVVCFIKVQSDS